MEAFLLYNQARERALIVPAGCNLKPAAGHTRMDMRARVSGADVIVSLCNKEFCVEKIGIEEFGPGRILIVESTFGEKPKMSEVGWAFLSEK